MKDGQERDHVRIRVQAALDPHWSEWLDGMQISAEESQGRTVTVLVGAVSDQAALRGLLSRLWDLNLIVLSVERLGEAAGAPGPGAAKEGGWRT